jgi:hypothetical protein
MIKHIDYTPTEEENEFLEFTQGFYFPWYFQKTVVESEKHKFFGHCLLSRQFNDQEPKEGVVNSDYYEIAKNLFLNVCKKNNIHVDLILRAAVNNTQNYSEFCGSIHVDHTFPHYNFIYHITETSSPTFLYDKDDNLITHSKPKKNRAVIFGGERHAQGTPAPYEHRIVLVFTFTGKIN